MCLSQAIGDTENTPTFAEFPPKGSIIARLSIGDSITLAPGFGKPPALTAQKLFVIDTHIFSAHCQDADGNPIYLNCHDGAGITHINGQPVTTV